MRSGLTCPTTSCYSLCFALREQTRQKSLTTEHWSREPVRTVEVTEVPLRVGREHERG